MAAPRFGREGDDAVVRKAKQRHAHDGAGDAEDVAQAGLGEPRAGRQAMVHDRLVDGVIDGGVGTRLRQRCERTPARSCLPFRSSASAPAERIAVRRRRREFGA